MPARRDLSAGAEQGGQSKRKAGQQRKGETPKRTKKATTQRKGQGIRGDSKGQAAAAIDNQTTCEIGRTSLDTKPSPAARQGPSAQSQHGDVFMAELEARGRRRKKALKSSAWQQSNVSDQAVFSFEHEGFCNLQVLDAGTDDYDAIVSAMITADASAASEAATVSAIPATASKQSRGQEQPEGDDKAVAKPKKKKKGKSKKKAENNDGQESNPNNENAAESSKPGETAPQPAAEKESHVAEDHHDDDDSMGDQDQGQDQDQERAINDQAQVPAQSAEDEAEGPDMSAWMSFGLHALVIQALAKLGFEKPTPVQEKCVPAAAIGFTDILGAAPTGSGKTLAFALPILTHILNLRDQAQQDPKKQSRDPTGKLNALVLTPTRELALQVKQHFVNAAQGTGIRVAAIVGGMSSQKQARLLSQKPEIVVGTPGRLWQLIRAGEDHFADIRRIRYLVVDEADRMVEKGHFKELDHILQLLPPPRNPAFEKSEGRTNARRGKHTPQAAAKEQVKGSAVDDDDDDENLDDEALEMEIAKEMGGATHMLAKLKQKGLVIEPQVMDSDASDAEGGDDDDEDEDMKQPATGDDEQELEDAFHQHDSDAEDNTAADQQGEDDEADETPDWMKHKQLRNDKGASKRATDDGAQYFGKSLQDEGLLLDDATASKPIDIKRQTFLFSATLTLSSQLQTHTRRGKSKGKKGGKGAIPLPVEADLDGKKGAEAGALKALWRIIDRCGIRKGFKIFDLSMATAGGSQAKTATATQQLADGLQEARIPCLSQEKDLYLYYILLKHPGRTLVFVNSIDCIRRLLSVLNTLQLHPLGLHAHMQQRQRLKNLDRFKEWPNAVMIATDVAARGLDIQGIENVIHYQVPHQTDTYVHRAGRTARAAAEGTSIILESEEDVQRYRKILRELGRPEDLPMYQVDRTYLPPLRKRIKLAVKIDTLTRQQSKAKSHNSWLYRAAKEADLDVDDSLLEEVPEQEGREAQQLKQAKDNLSRLLAQAVLPSEAQRGFSHGGRLADQALTNERARPLAAAQAAKKPSSGKTKTATKRKAEAELVEAKFPDNAVGTSVKASSGKRNKRRKQSKKSRNKKNGTPSAPTQSS